MKKKILIIGKGFLGSNLGLILEKNNHQISYSTHDSNIGNLNYVDITKKDSIVECLSLIHPDIVINCAANTQIDFLEKNQKTAYSINSFGPKNLSEVSEKFNIRLIHISTDYVFDGKCGGYDESSHTNPINIYGKSKERAEKFIEQISHDYVIIRSNFFGIDSLKRDLISNILSTLKSNNSFYGFNDIFYTPLEIGNLCEMIEEVCTLKFNGLLHLSSDESISKYQFACRVADIFDLDKNRIIKSSIDDKNLIAKRPKNTSLLNGLSKKILKTKPKSIDFSLKKIKTQLEEIEK